MPLTLPHEVGNEHRVSLKTNIEALILIIGFGAHYTIIIIRNPQNGIGTYLGPYSNTHIHNNEHQIRVHNFDPNPKNIPKA